MKIFMVFFVFLILVSCSNQQTLEQCESSQKEEITDVILHKTGLQLTEKFKLYPCGTGGQMMDEVKMLAISLNYYNPVEIEEGRKLLLAAADSLINEINSCNDIRPYLHNFPFSPRNVQVRIFLHNPDGSDVSSEKLKVLSMVDGKLVYKMDDPNGTLYIRALTESYEEAVEKLYQSESKAM